MDTTTTSSSSASAFGCCHRYRQCSDAKRCLLADVDSQRAASCAYRNNLEQGKIIYGKNATDFSQQQYAVLLEIYNSTSGTIRSAMDDIILYFVTNSYLASHVLWFYSVDIDRLQTLGLISYQRHEKLVLEKYTMKELKDSTGSKLQRKDELINHIIKEAPDTLSLLTSPYCYINIPRSNRAYITELYYDYFYQVPSNLFEGNLPFQKKKAAK